MAFTGEIGHLEGIESPWFNSGGVAKRWEELYALAQTGVGLLELGSITAEERLYKGPYQYNPATGEMFNRVEMDNMGIVRAGPLIKDTAELAESYNKKLIVNVATVTGGPEQEAVELVRDAYAAGAHAVLLNPFCPNVETEDKLAGILRKLAASGLEKPIFIKIPPQASFGQMNVTCKTIEAFDVCSAIFVSNSLKVEDSPIGPAGKSGPALAEAGYLETFWATTASKLDVVSCWGINKASELARRLGAGAVGGAGATFFFEPKNGWAEDTHALLTELPDYL